MINLMPPELKSDIRYSKANSSLVQYAVFIFIIGVSVSIVFLFGLSIVSGDKADLERSIQQKQDTLNGLSDVETQAKDLEEKIDTVNSLLDREIKFSILLQEIGAILPAGSYLTGLSVTGDTTEPLVLRATVNSQELAAVLRQNLEDSDLFAGADIQSISSNVTEDGGSANAYTTDILVQFAPDFLEANQ